MIDINDEKGTKEESESLQPLLEQGLTLKVPDRKIHNMFLSKIKF